jgi:hypothetical protein
MQEQLKLLHYIFCCSIGSKSKYGSTILLRRMYTSLNAPRRVCWITCSTSAHFLSPTKRGKVVRDIIVVHESQLCLVPEVEFTEIIFGKILFSRLGRLSSHNREFLFGLLDF